LSGAVSGTEMQVDIVGALPAGTAAIGKLAANSGVDIGDVDVTSIVPGTAATNLGKAEDVAHASGDVGVMALAVRKAAPVDVSGTDGDYEPLQIDNGKLWTQPVPLSTSNTTWVADGSLAADHTTASVDCREAKTIWFDIEMLSTSTPLGSVFIQGSVDDTTYVAMSIADGKMLTDSSEVTHVFATDPTKIVITSLSATANILVGFENPPPYVKFFWDRTSGGEASALDIGYSIRT